MTIDNNIGIAEPIYIALDSEEWIGMKTQGLNEQIKEYIWWKNIKIEDLNDEDTRVNLATYITELYLEQEVEAVIGRAVDINNGIDIIDKPMYGIYIQKDRRKMFSFFDFMDEEPKENLGEKHSIFDLIFDQVYKLLPN